MSFKTMGEFRDALAGLVKQAKQNKRRKRPRVQARKNMAIRYGGAVFDTPEELAAFKRLEQAAEPVELYVPTSRSVKKQQRARRTDAEGTGSSLPSKAQARNIARAVGWWKGFCPSAAGTNMTPAEVLGGMGLTYAKAKKVLEAFAEVGLPTAYTGPQHDPELAALAREILTKTGGVRCQVVAKANTASSFNRNVNWTAYPQYAYDFYAKPNEKPRAKKSRKRRSRARRNSEEAPAASFVPDPLIDNAGPYTPRIYPYGVGGAPGSYAKKNKVATAHVRVQAAQAGKTLSGGTAWPVHTREHAILALQYMATGFGGHWRSKYAQMVVRLAEIWPVEDDRNRDIWTAYRKYRAKIQTYTSEPLPTVAQLRGIA